MSEQKKCSDCRHKKCNCKGEQKVNQKVNVKVNVPKPVPTSQKGSVVCNSICGNLLLSDQVPNLEIWKERIGMDATVTISVFNSSMSTASIRVLVTRNERSPVEFTVPPGNTLSATVEDAESISVFRAGAGRTEGQFCLEVCFPVFCDNKRKQKS